MPPLQAFKNLSVAMATAKPPVTHTPTITTTTAAGRKSSRPPMPFQYPAAGTPGSDHDATVIRMIDSGNSWTDIEAIAVKEIFDRYYDILDPELGNFWTIKAIARLNQLVLDHRSPASPSTSAVVPATVGNEFPWNKIADIMDSTTGACKYVWWTFGDGRPISEEDQERARVAAGKKARLAEKRRKARIAKSQLRKAALLEKSQMAIVSAKQQAWTAARGVFKVNGHQLATASALSASKSHISYLSSDLDSKTPSSPTTVAPTPTSVTPALTTPAPALTTVTLALTTPAPASTATALAEIEIDIETLPVISDIEPETAMIQQEDEDSRQSRTRSRTQAQKLIDVRKLMEETARNKEEVQRQKEHDLAKLKEAQAALLRAEECRKQTGAEAVVALTSVPNGTGGNDIGANNLSQPDGHRTSPIVQELGVAAPQSLKRPRTGSQDLSPASAQKTKYSTQTQSSQPLAPEVIDLTADDPAPTSAPAKVATVVTPSFPLSCPARHPTAVPAPAVSHHQAQGLSSWTANTNPYYDVMTWTKEDTQNLWNGWLLLGGDWDVISRTSMQGRHSPQECQAFLLGKGAFL
ncbi:hypothetical protein BGZ58_002601 [Dissophora ornata]|nr:hypothetical protein BGZ58_002601 [Dissophora ornata]